MKSISAAVAIVALSSTCALAQAPRVIGTSNSWSAWKVYEKKNAVCYVHSDASSKKPEHLAFDLSVLDADGAVMFSGAYDLTLGETDAGTHLHVDLEITRTTVEAVPAVAGIETGWSQVLDQLVIALDRKDAQS